MRKPVIPCFVFLCVFVLVLITNKPVEAKKVPNFWIRNLEGDRFDTRRHKGPYVLSFFFVNCVPCIKEIPELHAMMSKEFPDSKLLFIDPVEDDSKREIAEFAKKLKIPEAFFYQDSLGSVSKKFLKRQFAFPMILGVSKKRLIFRHSGIDEDIEEDVLKELENQPNINFVCKIRL